MNPNNLDRAPPGGQHDNNFAELGSVHTDGIFRKVNETKESTLQKEYIFSESGL